MQPRRNGDRQCQAGDQSRRSVELSLSASSVNVGMVAAEAAVFDDEWYQGDERAAALLVAQQIGRQAEYDQLMRSKRHHDLQR